MNPSINNNYVRIGSLVKIENQLFRVIKIKSRLEIFVTTASGSSHLKKISFYDIDWIEEY